MPDGDRFERALRGLWRLPYRLAAAGSPPERVAERLSASCFALVTDDTAICAQKMMAAVDSALAQHAMPLFSGESHGTAFEWLTRSIDRIAADHHFDDVAQSSGRAASRCFLGAESQPHVGDAELEYRFSRELMSELAERHFFPKVREQVIENTGRDTASQRNWEAEVLQKLAETAPSLSKALFGDTAQRRTRRVVSSAQAPSFDWNRLNEPLHVLGAW